MKLYNSWEDLKEFGIIYLTSESCVFNLRILCDLTEKGKEIICDFFNLEPNSLAKPCNTIGNHIASILLPRRILLDLIMFSLIKDGQDVFQDDKNIYSCDLKVDYEIILRNFKRNLGEIKTICSPYKKEKEKMFTFIKKKDTDWLLKINNREELLIYFNRYESISFPGIQFLTAQEILLKQGHVLINRYGMISYLTNKSGAFETIKNKDINFFPNDI